MGSLIKVLFLSSALCGHGLFAQGRFRLADPIAVAGNGGGWNVTPAAGALTQSLSIASVQGELPIELNFRLNASHAVQVNHLWKQVPAYAYTEDGIRYRTTEWVDQGTAAYDRPMYATLHFGYVTGGATYGYVPEPVYFVLEDGRILSEKDFSPFSALSTGTFDLAQRFGFVAKNASAVSVDPSGTLGTYLATPSEMGTWQATLQAAQPANYGVTIGQYKVVLDKDKARVFGFLPTFNAWAPMLWVDRFGHSVTFKWTHNVNGLIAEMKATDTVEAVNQRGKGVRLSWGLYYSTVTATVDLVRADFIGVAAPSILIKGYPGMSGLRPNSMATLAGSAGIIRPDIAGPTFRPTLIQIGEPSEIAMPAWGAATPTLPIAPQGSGDVGIATWQFSYDANRAALSGSNDPLGVQSSWIYATPTFVTPGDASYAINRDFNGGIWQAVIETTSLFGVAQMDRADPITSATERQTWIRTIPNGSTQTNWTVKYSSWFPSKGAATRYTEFTYSPTTSAREYSNGALQSMRILTTQGDVMATQYQTWTGSSANVGTSIQSAVKYTRAGEPDRMVAMTFVDDKNIQVARQSTYLGKQVSTPAATTDFEWDSNFALLDLNRPKTVTNKRYSMVSGSQIQPARVIRTEYDPATLLPFRSYLDGGNGLQHGQATAYDSEGRPNYSQVSHNEPGFSWSIPYYASISFDAGTGLPSTKSISYWDPDSTVRSTVVETLGAFDSAGRPTTATDARGIRTTVLYDRRGRLLSRSSDGSATVSFGYPDERTFSTTVNGRTSTEVRDGFGRLVSRTQPDGSKVEFGYDVHGRLEYQKEFTATGGSRTTSSQTYDALDRTITQVSATNSGMTLNYSVDSGAYAGASDLAVVTQTTMGLNIISKEYLDGFGQTVKQVAPTGEVTDYTYDGVGQQTKISLTPPPGSPLMTVQVRTFGYDALGRLVTKTEPETGMQVFSQFNGFSQPGLVQEGVTNGVASRSRSLVFDGLGRLRKISNGPDSLSYTYNGPDLTVGTSIHGSEIVSQTYEYWPDLVKGKRLKKESLQTAGIVPAFGYSIQYDYDSLGRLNLLTYPSGRVVGYEYDADSRVVGIKNGGTPLVVSVEFDDWGNRSRLAFGSGAASEWKSKDSGLHLDQWSVKYASSTVLSGPRVYTYDSAERLTQAGEWAISQIDSAGRVLSANASSFNINTSHGYDAYGNAISHTASGAGVPPSMNNFSFGPMLLNSLPSGTSGWSINPMGEATAMAAGTGSLTSTTFGWDGLGRLSSAVSNTGGTTQSYRYAPTGLRMQLVDSADPFSNRRFAYTSSGLLVSEFTDGGWKRDVVYLGSEAIAELDATGTYELHNDHLGTPRLITQGNGASQAAIVGVQNYGPYGEYLVYHSNGYQPLTGYTGHVQTDRTGLIYMRGRYYSPAWHRFLNSDDGADPTSLNQNAYTGGSPFMWTDPSGLSSGYCITETTITYNDSNHNSKLDPGETILDIQEETHCYGGGGGGSSEGSGATPDQPKTPEKTEKTCVGTARIKAGPKNINNRKLGAFGSLDHSPGGAALIYSQWGYTPDDKGEVRSMRGQFSAYLSDGTQLFNRWEDVADNLQRGDRKKGIGLQARQNRIINDAGGLLVIEVYGGKDLGVQAGVVVNVPKGNPCPTGFSEQK